LRRWLVGYATAFLHRLWGAGRRFRSLFVGVLAVCSFPRLFLELSAPGCDLRIIAGIIAIAAIAVAVIAAPPTTDDCGGGR
jgi:hypothetical protein